mgnify:CR=1 FL=1|tara:strand:+ start:424 stop:612 length:189 start_codon:yes stop_codon:yes gene_type:complete
MTFNTGDLVKMNADWVKCFGFGIIMEVISEKQVLVRWFDDWSDTQPFEVTDTKTIQVLSKGG